MIVEGFAVVPTAHQRKADLMQQGSYSLRRMPGLRRPLLTFPAGMFPFGRELDHLTDEQLGEARRDA